MCIKWGNINSDYFNIVMVYVRVGYCHQNFCYIYIDDLSNELALCKSRCYINEQCMNHVIYADDICLLAPFKIECILYSYMYIFINCIIIEFSLI